jgi:asparagine synthase (glutamine-hydrolysing)
MADVMAYRGPDGSKTWQEGPIGLAHCHFWTTPEDAGEEQPVGSADGRLWITADARVDNRRDLIPALEARGFLGRSAPTDAEVILAAYQCWGDDCARHLIGDFAFAVWDAPAQRLFMARDVFGIRQLYYALVDGRLCFATAIRGVLAALERRPALNRGLIEQFLRASYQPWICQTAYDGVMRLPPAHHLTATRDGLSRPQLYYVLGARRAPRPSSDREWCEAYRAYLEEAVQPRLRSTTAVAISVSGGLDSSSVACVAHELSQQRLALPQVRLYSAVFSETPRADESEYFDAVAARCNRFHSTRIVADDHWALREFGGDGGFPLDEPESYSLRSLNLALLRASASDGCRVMLVGTGGDHVLSKELYSEPAALRGVAWQDWPLEVKYYHRSAGMGWAALLLRAYVKPLLPAPVARLAEVLYAARAASSRPWLNGSRPSSNGQCCSLDERYFGPRGLSAAAEVMHRVARRAREVAAHSALDVCAAYAGVELRSPFWDRRLVDFLLGIPHHLRAWRGVDRVIARESLRGVLPEVVRRRSSKAHFGDLTRRGLRERERPRIESLLREPRAEALGLLDGRLLGDAFQAYWRGETHRHQEIIRPLYLEAWLRTGS